MKAFQNCFFFVLLLLSCANEKGDPSFASIQTDFEQTWMGKDSVQTDSIRRKIAGFKALNEYTLYCRAWLQSKNGNKSRALKTADSLVMGFPGFIKGYYLRANIRAELNDTEGAIADFGKAIKRDPTFFEAYMNRGSLQFSRKHPDEALKDFESAAKLKSGNEEVLLNLGNARMALGQPDSACICWNKATQKGNEKAKALVERFCIEKN
jgi:tetratricopeptide (TPR) repeat protein